MKFKQYMQDVISPSDTTSSRKFVTLLIAAHFIFASFVVLFFAFYVILWAPKGKTDVDLLNTLKVVLQYDFYIILSGLGFITSSDLVRVMVSKGFNPTPIVQNVTTSGDIQSDVAPVVDASKVMGVDGVGTDSTDTNKTIAKPSYD